MPVVEFTFSERRWYTRETQIVGESVQEARAALQKAEADAKILIGRTLAEICQSHNESPPPNAELVKDRSGAVIGIVWGKDLKDWTEGRLKIEGSVVPVLPKPPTKPADKKMLEDVGKKLAEKAPPKSAPEGAEKQEAKPVDVGFRADESAAIVEGTPVGAPENGAEIAD